MLNYLIGLLLLISGIAPVYAEDAPVTISSTTTMVNIEPTIELVDARAGAMYYRYSRPDLRKCMYPMCGGFYVTPVNNAKAFCDDGKRQKECYVANLDTQALGWLDEQQTAFRALFEQKKALVLGQIFKTPFYETTASTLMVNRAWQSAIDKENPQESGIRYYRVEDNGIRCIKAPCANVQATELNNGRKQYALSGLDLAATGASQAAIDQAMNDFSNDAVLVAGQIHRIKGERKAKQLIADNFYQTATTSANNGGTVAEGGMCGGIQGLVCQKGLVCDITIPNACSGADLSGVCITPPEICTMDYNPVCGCDGVTYSNDCARKAAGAQLAYAGACKK